MNRDMTDTLYTLKCARNALNEALEFYLLGRHHEYQRLLQFAADKLERLLPDTDTEDTGDGN